MANQMIALQARGPQMPDMGAQLARFGNMMARQQAANRQSEVAQQTMDTERAKEARAAAKEGRDIKEFQLKIANDAATIFRDGLASWVRPGDVAAAQALRDEVVGLVPAWDKIIPPADVLANNPATRKLAFMKANEIIEYTTTKPEVEVQIEPGTSKLQEVMTGGVEGITPRGAFELPGYEIDPNAGKPSAAPQSAFPKTAAPATDAQIEEAAQKIIRGAGVGELGISAEDFDRATARANQMTAGGGARMQPISMTTGARMGGQPDMAAVVQDMMSSGQISQSNLQLMRERAGPDKEAQLAQVLKDKNIQIVPDEQPGMRSAVYRPGVDGAPQMQLAQAMEGYRPTGRAARGKDPMQAPTPGSATVPLKRVRDEAAAGRESPAEAADKARAVAAVAADADIAKQERQRAPARKQVSTLVGKVRNAYEALEKAQAIPSEKRGGFENAMAYMATSSAGREAQKMVATNASKYLSEITNSRKLLATAIKNAAGMTAQEMNSNVELTLMLDALTDPTQGIEAARSTLDTLEELFGSRTAPSSGARGRASTDRSVDSNNPLLRD